MNNVYLEKLAEIAEDKGHTPRRPRSTAAGATASVAAGAAIGLGAGHALNKVHDKAVTNAEDIIRSKGADAIGNAGRAQKEHVAQALFRDAEILNAGADSIASKAGALSKLRGRLALGGAALGGAAYAAHRLTEKKAEDNSSGVLDASLYTAAGAAGAAIPTSLHAGMVRKTIEQKRDNRLAKFNIKARDMEGLARADHSVAKARTLAANFDVDEHDKYGRGIFSTKDSYLAEANRLHAAQDAAKAGEIEASKKLSSTLRNISNRRDTIISRYGKLTSKLNNRVLTSAGVGAGVGLAAYGVHKLTEKKAEEEANKSMSNSDRDILSKGLSLPSVQRSKGFVAGALPGGVAGYSIAHSLGKNKEVKALSTIAGAVSSGALAGHIAKKTADNNNKKFVETFNKHPGEGRAYLTMGGLKNASTAYAIAGKSGRIEAMQHNALVGRSLKELMDAGYAHGRRDAAVNSNLSDIATAIKTDKNGK